MNRKDPIIEKMAKAIYDLLPYDGKSDTGSKPEWVPNGNSLKQDEARRYAQAALEAIEVPEFRDVDAAFTEAMQGYVRSTGATADARVWFSKGWDARAVTVDEPVWERMDSAPRDGTVILIRWGEDGYSPGWWTGDDQYPWSFFDTNSGGTFANRGRDGEYGPSHWAPYQWNNTLKGIHAPDIPEGIDMDLIDRARAVGADVDSGDNPDHAVGLPGYGASIAFTPEQLHAFAQFNERTSGESTGSPGVGAFREALRDVVSLVERETCMHEDTHRGGAIWTICDGCGRKWADDEGGFQPHEDPPAIKRAYELLDMPPVKGEEPYTVVYRNSTYEVRHGERVVAEYCDDRGDIARLIADTLNNEAAFFAGQR